VKGTTVKSQDSNSKEADHSLSSTDEDSLASTPPSPPLTIPVEVTLAARKKAELLGVDLSKVTPSLGDFISVDDVRKHYEESQPVLDTSLVPQPPSVPRHEGSLKVRRGSNGKRSMKVP